MISKKRSYQLYIIESPNDDDLFDKRTEGALLTEALRLSRVSKQSKSPVEYHLVVSKEIFGRVMEKDLPKKLKKADRVIPILHFSMHGDKHGLRLTDGTEIDWNKLSKLLSDINKNYANGELIVCLSACGGLYGGYMQLSDRRRRPFKVLVGPENEPFWADAAVAFTTFYHLLINKGRTVGTAVEAMKTASGNHKFQSITPKEILAGARRFNKLEA